MTKGRRRKKKKMKEKKKKEKIESKGLGRKEESERDESLKRACSLLAHWCIVVHDVCIVAMLNIPTSVSRVEAPTHVLLPLLWLHAPSSVGREIEPHRLYHGGWLLYVVNRWRGKTEKYDF